MPPQVKVTIPIALNAPEASLAEMSQATIVLVELHGPLNAQGRLGPLGDVIRTCRRVVAFGNPEEKTHVHPTTGETLPWVDFSTIKDWQTELGATPSHERMAVHLFNRLRMILAADYPPLTLEAVSVGKQTSQGDLGLAVWFRHDGTIV